MKREAPVGIVRRLCALGTIEREMGDGTKAKAFVASTDKPDRYDDIIDQLSWKLDNFRANPVMPCDHEYTCEKLVCNGDVAVVDGRLTVVPTRWSSKPYAQMVKDDVDAGIIRAVSVGFLPGRAVQRRALDKDHAWFDDKSWGYVFYDCDLLEISFVVVPANAEALATEGIAAKGLSSAIDVDALTDAVKARLAADSDFLARLLAAPMPPSGGASDNLSHLWEKP